AGYLRMPIAGKRIGPSRPGRPPWGGIGVVAEVPEQIVLGIEYGHSPIELGDDQQVAPLGKIAGAVEELLTEGPQIAAVEIVDEHAGVDSVGNVELRECFTAIDENCVRARESLADFLASQCRPMVSLLVEAVHDT